MESIYKSMRFPVCGKIQYRVSRDRLSPDDPDAFDKADMYR